MVKVFAFALCVGFVYYVFFYLRKKIKPGSGARFRYIVFAVFAFFLAAFLLRVFVK